MAIYWNAAAVFATRTAALELAAQLSNTTIPTTAGDLRIGVTIGDGPSGAVVGLWPEGMSYGSPRGNNDPRAVEDAVREQVAQFFEQRFAMTEPRIAAFGAEMYDRFVDERIEDIALPDGMEGLIIGEAEHLTLGRPRGAVRFADGLLWWPRTRTP